MVFALLGDAGRKLSLRLSMMEWQSAHPNPKRIILGLAHFSRLDIVLPGCAIEVVLMNSEPIGGPGVIVEID